MVKVSNSGMWINYCGPRLCNRLAKNHEKTEREIKEEKIRKKQPKRLFYLSSLGYDFAAISFKANQPKVFSAWCCFVWVLEYNFT